MSKKGGITVLGLVLAVLFVIAILGALAGVKVLQIQKLIADGQNFQVPPEPVTTAVAETQAWVQRLRTFGNVTSVQGVAIAAEAAGVVREVAVSPGARVQAGDVILRLNTDVEEAQLAGARARADLARQQRERAQSLLAEGSSSQDAFDAATAGLKDAEATVLQIEAVIAQKTVRAPFAGRLGILYVRAGQFLDRGVAIASLENLDTVYVDFTLPQQRLGSLRPGQQVEVVSNSAPGQVFAGEILAIDPAIDPVTRNIRVQALFRNPGEALRPGMFVSVAVVLAADRRVVVIPASGVLHAPYGDSVFVVQAPGEDGVRMVKSTAVRLGEARGDFVEVVSGLEAGLEVVSTGAFKLRDGMAVVVRNDLAPTAELNPTPANS